MIILSSIYWFLVALFIALFEIEIEGKYGWAEKTATWNRKFRFPKNGGRFSISRSLTGYHLFLNIFLFLFMHSTFFLSGTFSIEQELKLLSIYFTWILVWDYLWFILNPYYGLNAFSQKSVWWFGKEPWILGRFPVKYLLQLAAAFLLSYIATRLTDHSGYIIDQGIRTVVFIILIVLSHFLLKPIFHRYYWRFHKRVD